MRYKMMLIIQENLCIVNYYTNGGEAGKVLQSSENQKITEELKQAILSVELVDFENL